MKNLSLFMIPFLLVACKGKFQTVGSIASVNSEALLFSGQDINVEALKDSINLEMDISNLSLSDIRILRNAFAARQGYCFMKADLRAIFATTTWYNQRMEDRFWSEEEGRSTNAISFTKEEQVFIDKLEKRENELLELNFIQQDNRKMANLNNIVNLFQLEKIDPELMEKLGRNGFAIVPNNNIQFFHVYEQNDYQQFPHFVTTDMYMQLFHMYFGYVLRTVEETQFIPILSKICESMLSEMKAFGDANPDESVKELVWYNTTFMQLPILV